MLHAVQLCLLKQIFGRSHQVLSAKQHQFSHAETMLTLDSRLDPCCCHPWDVAAAAGFLQAHPSFESQPQPVLQLQCPDHTPDTLICRLTLGSRLSPRWRHSRGVVATTAAAWAGDLGEDSSIRSSRGRRCCTPRKSLPVRGKGCWRRPATEKDWVAESACTRAGGHLQVRNAATGEGCWRQR